MIKVYGAPPTRGLRVLWMLEEMGLDYQLLPIDFAKRREDAAFLDASPCAALPALIDGEVKMMESMAIVEYLAARHGPTPLALAPSDRAFPLYKQFVHFGEASLAAPLNVAIATRFYAPEAEKQNWGAQFAVKMTIQRAEAVERQLQQTPCLAGESFTAADISCTYALGLLPVLGGVDQLGSRTQDYIERMRSRPAYQRAMRHAAPLSAQAA